MNTVSAPSSSARSHVSRIARDVPCWGCTCTPTRIARASATASEPSGSAAAVGVTSVTAPERVAWPRPIAAMESTSRRARAAPSRSLPLKNSCPRADTPHVNSDRRRMPGRRRTSDEVKWIDRWLAACADLDELKRSNPMTDAVIDEIDGRRIRVGDQWLVDFASCNYLGFDLDREIMDSIPAHVEKWGTHPSWSRLLGSPMLFGQIEERLTELLGCEDSLVLPTITHIHMSVIPVLAAGGTIFMDSRAHKTIYDGCQFAVARGATLKRFRFEDPDDLERLLVEDRSDRRLVCMDGVNSITGNAPDLAAFARVTRRHGALLYVDDAHGFGVIGERSPRQLSPYGNRGNSIVRHLGESYEGIILVGGFSKAYSSLAAFIACPTALKEMLKTAAPPYLYSGPPPVASLATTLAGFDVNERRGDELRLALYERTGRVLEALRRLGVRTLNHSGFPIIEIPLGDHRDIGAVGRFLFDNGIYVTLAAYPLVPKDEVGFRIQVTAANGDDEIDELIDVLEPRSRSGSSCSRPTICGRPHEPPDPSVRGALWPLSARTVWLWYLLAGSLLTYLYVVVPTFQRGSTLHGPLINVLGLSGAIAILAGMRMHRPKAVVAWGFMFVGQMLFVVGDFYTYSLHEPVRPARSASRRPATAST